MTRINQTRTRIGIAIRTTGFALGFGIATTLPGHADTASCTVPDIGDRITDAQASALYECLTAAMAAQLEMLESGGTIDGPSWLRSDMPVARAFLGWESVTTAPYESGTHGGRFVVNLADPVALPSYSRFEDGGPMPMGGILAKPSFTVSDDGTAALGPLFLMERAADGTYPDMGDWIYSAIMPDGSVMGPTGGPQNDRVQFCADCHLAIGADTDSMTYLPDEYRVTD